MLFGAFNGILVAGFKIQPMVATLILYTAGRSIAAWINNNELPVISDPSFGYFGGFIPGIQFRLRFYCGSMYDRYGTGYEIYKPWFVYAGSRY